MDSEAAFLSRVDDNLVPKLHELCLGVGENPSQPLGTRVEALLNDVEATIESISVDGLRDSERNILVGVSFNVARLRWPVPRLACLLPNHSGTLSEDDRAYGSWSTRLKTWCNEGKPDVDRRFREAERFVPSKETISPELRLFFLCAHDLSLAECGSAGQGYEVNELYEWSKKASPLVKLELVLGSIVLKTCTALSVPTHRFEAAFGDTLGVFIPECFKEEGSPVVDGMNKAAENLSGDGVEQMRELIEARQVDPK